MKPSGQLRQAGREPEAPWTTALPEGDLRIESWLRVLPGKRLVGAGDLAGRKVLAKLFVGAHAARHVERERAGIAALQQAGIRTPGMIAMGQLDSDGAFLLSELLPDAQSLQVQWDALPNASPDSAEALDIVGRALRAIAQMHAAGVLQGDLHLGNFLLSRGEFFVIDGDAVEAVSIGTPLTQAVAERNLALFLAQLPPAWDEARDTLLVDYLMGNPHCAIHPERLQQQVNRLRARRLASYLEKTVRDCSLFAVRRSWLRFSAVWRTRADSLQSLMEQPDQAFAETLLKDGGSSTVARHGSGASEVLVKRYNIKGLVHWLSRFWRPTRAWHAWQAGHRLRFLGLQTPEPLALIEERFGPLRRRGWLITAFAPGQQLLDVLGCGDELPSAELGQAILSTFSGLHAARISHGDCKATNFLWDGQVLFIIDLDSMQAHRAGGAWLRAWGEDRARLIRNWPADSPLARWLDENLPR
jgi:tRNA A-37 threonylcarbamoyl transferase component Bud32